MDRVFNATARNALTFVLGFGMKSLGYFAQEDGARAIGLVVKFMVPFVMMSSVPGIKLDVQWLALAILCVVYSAVLISIFRLGYKYVFPELGKREQGQCLMLSMGHAVALVGLPIMDGYYGRPGLIRAAVFDAANLLFAYIGTFVCATSFADTLDELTQKGTEFSTTHQNGPEKGLTPIESEHSKELEAIRSEYPKQLEDNEIVPKNSTNRIAQFPVSTVAHGKAVTSEDHVNMLGNPTQEEDYSIDAVFNGDKPITTPASDVVVNLDSPMAAPSDLVLMATPSSSRREATPSGRQTLMQAISRRAMPIPTVSTRSLAVANAIRDPSTPNVSCADSKVSLAALGDPASTTVLACELLRNVAMQPPVIGMVVGILLKIVGLQVEDLPTCITMFLKDSGSAAGPVTFFVLGVFFSPSLFQQRMYLGRLIKLLSIRYTFAIATALAIKWLWPPGPDELLPVVGGLCVLMPVPPVCIAFSSELGYDVDFAALVVNATLICSFVLAFSYAAFCGV